MRIRIRGLIFPKLGVFLFENVKKELSGSKFGPGSGSRDARKADPDPKPWKTFWANRL